MIKTASQAFEVVNQIFETNYPGLIITSINVPESVKPTWIVNLTFSRNSSKFDAIVELDAVSDLVRSMEVTSRSELMVTSEQLIKIMDVDRLAELAKEAGLSDKQLKENRQLLSQWLDGKLREKGVVITPDALDALCNIIVSLMESIAESIKE